MMSARFDQGPGPRLDEGMTFRVPCTASARCRYMVIPLVNIQKTMEHGPFIVDLPIKHGDFI